nr:response regulator [Ardenticatenales bacterium]
EFARNGLEALSKAEELTPDLIVLDVMMPQMNGFEVCQRLRASASLSEVPIILVTALDDYDSRLRGIEVGADDFITKPFDLVEFQARIRTITRLGRFRRLLMERAKFEWLVEQAEEGYLMLSEQDEILYANPRARHFLALSEEKRAVEPTFLEVVRERYHCEPREAWATWPDQPSDLPPSPRFLIHAEIPTAPALWLRVDLLALRGERQGGWLVRLRDVSREMALQQDMWKFHAVVSHKLRTPAANATSSLNLLARHAAKLSTEEIVEMASSAERNLQRLREEIEDIFQYLTAPTLALPGSGVHLAEVVGLITTIASDLGLEPVAFTLPQELERARILVSVQGLELILREILQNAKKFHPRQAPRVEIDVTPASFKEVRVRIADDGATLSPSQLAQVWTPYYQGERHFSGEVQGMGLGLPMVAALIWEAGGSSSIANRTDAPGVIVDLILPTRRTLPPLSF